MYKYLPLLLIALAWSSCTKFTTMLFHAGTPSNDDYQIFQNRLITHSDTPFYFMRDTSANLGENISIDNLFISQESISMNEFFRKSKSLGLLIIRNDTILYEKYDKRYNAHSIFNSFSMAKSMVSTLIEIAIEQGYIKSIDDYLITYLPEFAKHKGFSKIKIAHLIAHESGIYVPAVLPDAPFYWGNNLRRMAQRARVIRAPEKKFVYSSINFVLLGLILEKATGTSVAHYFEKNLWQPLGMESDALWSVDAIREKKKNRALEKVFCCINARMVDFAKYGRLFMRYGEFNHRQIVSRTYVERSVKYQEPKNKRGKSVKKRRFFQNNWALGPRAYGSFYTWGLWGQTIYVYPKKNIIIVRFSKVHLFRYNPQYILKSILQIVDQLS